MSETTDSNANAVSDLVTVLTPDQMREIMQDRGYRVETATADNKTVLRSATNGFGFELRFSNQQGNDGERYADAAFLAALKVEGQLSLDIVNEWNNAKRFARLHLLGDMLILNMDICVVGGVSANYLRTQVEIWDRLVQEFIPYLRTALNKAAPVKGGDNGSAQNAGEEQAAPAAG